MNGQVKRLTPPGPISRPTMISKMPWVICFRVRAMMPETTSTTAMIHKMNAMSYTSSERLEDSVSVDGTMTVGSTNVVISAGSELVVLPAVESCTVVLR